MHAALAATRYFLQEWGKHAWDAADAPPIDLADVEQASGAAPPRSTRASSAFDSTA